MAHCIEVSDKVFTIAKAWHGLETQVEKIEGFGFEVMEAPIGLMDGGEIPTYKAIVTDSGRVISVMKSSYELISNARVWEAAQTAVAQLEGARIVSAGSIKGQSQTFITVELDGLSNFKAGGDAHTAKLNLINSHDGSKAFTARAGFTRIVCANTVSAAERESRAGVKLYHTRGARAEIQGLNRSIEDLVKATEFYKSQMEQLKNERCDLWTAQNFAAGLVANGDELSGRTRNQAKEIAYLFTRGKGNSGETRYDLFNGVTEFFTHRATSDKSRLFESSEFGTYCDRKTEALGLLLNVEKFKDTVAKGKELLAA